MLFDNKVQRYIESYRELWAAYQEARCDPWEAGDCVEPSLGDFVEILREQGNFFIRDPGFVEIPARADPQPKADARRTRTENTKTRRHKE